MTTPAAAALYEAQHVYAHEGMKAENRKREKDGHAPAYSEIDFFNEAESLEVLAIQAINTQGG